MKTIWMLSAKYLKRNLKRTSVMIACMSVASLMITVVTVFAFSYQYHMKREVIQKEGNWHVEFHDLTKKQAEMLKMHPAVKCAESERNVSGELNDPFDKEMDGICVAAEFEHVNFMIQKKTDQIAEEIGMEVVFEDYNYSRDFIPYNVSFHTNLLEWEGINVESFGKGQAVIFLVGLVIVMGSVFMYYAVNIAWDEQLRFIGLLGSAGASAKQKRNIIYTEGLVVGIVGSVIGFLLGILFLKLRMKQISYFFWGKEIVNMRFSLWEFLIIFVSVILILLMSCSSAANAATEVGIQDLLSKNSMQDIEGKKRFVLTKKRRFCSTEFTMALKNIAVYHKKYHSSCVLLVIVLCIILDGYVYARSATGMYFDYAGKKKPLYPHVAVTGWMQEGEKENIEEYIKKVRMLPKVGSATVQKVKWCFGGFAKTVTTMGNGEEIKQYQQEIQLTGLDEETYQKCLETVGVSKEKRNDAFAIVSGSPEEYEKNDYLYLVEDEVGLSEEYKDHPDGMALPVLAITEKPLLVSNPLILNRRIKEKEFYFLMGYVGRCRRVYVPMEQFDALTAKLEASKDIEYPQILDVCMKQDIGKFVSEQDLLYQKNIIERIHKEQHLMEQMEPLSETYKEGEIELYSVARSQIRRFIENPDETLFLFAKGFTVMTAVFAIVSILQKISFSIRLRKKEFALLQAMGMTKSRIYRMILLEHSVYGIVGLFIGIPLSLFLMVQIFAEGGIAFNEITKEIIPFEMIGIQILLIVFVIVIPLLYTVLMMRKIDMIEVIRNENE